MVVNTPSGRSARADGYEIRAATTSMDRPIITTVQQLAAAGIAVGHVEKGAAIVDRIRTGRCDLVVNTPQGSGARGDGYRIREAALAARIPCITTLSGAAAAVQAIAAGRAEEALSLQERLSA